MALPPMTRYDLYADQDHELVNWFSHHPPRDGSDQAERYALIRSQGGQLGRSILRLTPPSREQSIAIEKIREAVMWANAAIAVHDG